MSTELEPCPFCGSDAAVLDGKSDSCRVRCESCGTEGRPSFFNSDNYAEIEIAEEEARYGWNQRAAVPAVKPTAWFVDANEGASWTMQPNWFQVWPGDPMWSDNWKRYPFYAEPERARTLPEPSPTAPDGQPSGTAKLTEPGQ